MWSLISRSPNRPIWKPGNQIDNGSIAASYHPLAAKSLTILREHLHEAVAIFHEGQELRVTSSLGMCAYSNSTPHTKGMVRQADEALYACKAAGRNCVSSLNHPPQR